MSAAETRHPARSSKLSLCDHHAVACHLHCQPQLLSSQLPNSSWTCSNLLSDARPSKSDSLSCTPTNITDSSVRMFCTLSGTHKIGRELQLAATRLQLQHKVCHTCDEPGFPEEAPILARGIPMTQALVFTLGRENPHDEPMQQVSVRGRAGNTPRTSSLPFRKFRALIT